jgi:hypothetical protein
VVNPNHEREDTFEVDADWAVPDLAAVLPTGAVLEQQTMSLSTRYFDTAAQDLLRQGVTLRLRTGHADSGWRLQLSDGAARAEARITADGNGRAACASPLSRDGWPWRAARGLSR